MGWWNETEEPFDFFKAYGSAPANDVIYPLYVGRRIWRVYDILQVQNVDMNPYWGKFPIN